MTNHNGVEVCDFHPEITEGLSAIKRDTSWILRLGCFTMALILSFAAWLVLRLQDMQLQAQKNRLAIEQLVVNDMRHDREIEGLKQADKETRAILDTLRGMK